MKKSWCNSLAVVVLLLSVSACKQHTAAETESESGNDTTALTVDTSAAQPDNTSADPDSIAIIADSVANGSKQPATTEGSGDSKKPGPKPKPGKMSSVDSIKASYPPKK